MPELHRRPSPGAAAPLSGSRTQPEPPPEPNRLRWLNRLPWLNPRLGPQEQVGRPEPGAAPLERERWGLPLRLGAIVCLGFAVVAGFTYTNALESARREVRNTTLPLALDALSADLQRELTEPVLLAASMAANSFLTDWQAGGEIPTASVLRYLRNVQDLKHSTTTFFVSDRSGRYYHPQGILKTISPRDPQDAWYFRLKDSRQPYQVNLDRDTADRRRTTVFVNYKLFDRTGRFSGAIGVGHSTNLLTALIQREELLKGIDVLFIDADGRTLSLNTQQSSPPSLDKLPGIGGRMDEILSRNSTSFSYRRDGREFILLSKWLPELNWRLVVTKPIQVGQGIAWESALQIALIGAGCLGLMLLLVYRASNRHHGRISLIACTDPLSGALNRNAFRERFDALQRSSLRRRTSLAVAILDIDHFKTINDRFGHPTGDAVIRVVAQAIQGCTRRQDLLFRWGGEEFLLLLPEITLPEATSLLRRITPAVAAVLNAGADDEGTGGDQAGAGPADGTGSAAGPAAGSAAGSANAMVPGVQAPTLSSGVTLLRRGDSAESVVSRADRALYQAKHAGRNQTVGL